MPQTSKELVRAIFAGKPVSRPPFIPCIATAAARFMQVPIRQMYSNPTALANSVQACQRLFKYDGIVVLYEPTLEAEALGCQLFWQEDQPPQVAAPIISGEGDLDRLDASGIEGKGRIPAVLEAAKRLGQTVGREVAMVGVITGPVTLGKHLMGESFLEATDADNAEFNKMVEFSGKVAVALARAFGELNFDAVILADQDMVSLKSEHYSKLQPVLKTLHNVLNFYNAPLIIGTGRIPDESLPDFYKLEADGFSSGSLISSEFLPAGKLNGRCISSEVLAGSADDIDKAMSVLLEGASGAGCFITSENEVPLETPATNLHRVMEILTTSSVK